MSQLLLKVIRNTVDFLKVTYYTNHTEFRMRGNQQVMIIVKQKTVCFSGHRSERLPKSTEVLDELRLKIYNEIDKALNNGFDSYIFGACYGFDLMCAEILLLRRRIIKMSDPKCIRLIAAVPFEEQASKWREIDRELYFDTLSKCDEVITISTRFNMNCYHKRNQYMVDNSSRLICYYDGGISGTAYTVNYAKEKGCETINLY
jgi:uncharacterized phage-like protein YoqJ